MKDWVEIITKHLSSVVERLAAVVISIALLQFIVRYATWDDIGKLGAIAVLRTGLNFFLERELRTSGLTEIDKPRASFLKQFITDARQGTNI